jgi:hypothetical protein
MNEEGTAWEEETIRAFFHNELATTILQIPSVGMAVKTLCLGHMISMEFILLGLPII